MKIFSPILKGTTTVAQGTTNLSGSFTGSLFGTAATASYADNFTVGGTLTAQTINVQVITSSIEFNTGSTRNGALSTNTHQFTGSVSITGSAAALLSVNNNILYVSSSGNVLIGTTTGDNYKLQIVGSNQATSTFGQTYAGVAAYSQWISSSNAFVMGFDGAAGTTARMTITGAGNVGIGTTAPNALLHIFAPTTIVDSNGQLFVCASDALGADKGGQIMLGARYTSTLFTAMGGISAKKNNATDNDYNGYLQFFTSTQSVGNTEKMRITSAGRVGINTDSPATMLHIRNATAQTDVFGYLQLEYTTAASGNAGLTTKNSFGTGQFMQWEHNGLRIGSRIITSSGQGGITFTYGSDFVAMTISSNGSIGAPTGTNIYNASDIRLKQNISPTTYGLNTISLLNPVKFNWVDGFEPTEDGKDMLGFVAQEVQTVIPEAIESFGGNSITVGDTVIDNPLRVNEKFIIPVLVKAIQELKSENDTLKEILQRNNIQ
jgi:hypothetical protein